ncbi:MAG: nucleotidyltransferase domain-containing protein [Candidatus Aenigmarchaeota archaeon]|nr:nucleotidyltransferase domain-containing protein [Candidatus Aenigmarchaeota archaeon]
MYQKRNRELEVLSLFTINYKREIYLREISKFSRIPLKTTQNTLKSLEKSRIIKSMQRGKNKYFSLNMSNIQTKLYLIQAEIYKTGIFLEKYPQFKTFLKEVTAPNPMIVFGSYAKLTANKNSDIDILTISKKKPKLPFHLLPNKIQLINLSENDFIDSFRKQEALMKEIEENHVVLNNHSFYVNALWNHYGR